MVSKQMGLQFTRVDMWWAAILVLISAALNFHVIFFTLALLVTWPLVDRFAPAGTKRVQDVS